MLAHVSAAGVRGGGYIWLCRSYSCVGTSGGAALGIRDGKAEVSVWGWSAWSQSGL